MPIRACHVDHANDNAADDIMFLGLDVTHGTNASSKGTPSIACLTASMDKDFSQHPAETRLQSAPRHRDKKGAAMEITIPNLEDMLLQHLRRWVKRHVDKLPHYIIKYRDGIGKDQYDEALNKELPRLKQAVAQMQAEGFTTPSGRDVKFTFIVVGKGHEARLFAQSSNGKYENAPGGTYVDKGITETKPWEFYLQSHNALKGTARSGHYVVIHDEIIREQAQKRNPPIDPASLIAKITHTLCYLFSRSTGATSIPSPVYCAHLACKRARGRLSDVIQGRVQVSLHHFLYHTP